MAVTLVNPYCTVEEVQDFLEDSKADHVDRIARAINAGSRYVDSISDHIFYRKQYTNEPVQRQSRGRNIWSMYPAVFKNQAAFIKSPFNPIIRGSVTLYDNGVELIEGQDFTVDYENGKIYAANYSFASAEGFLPTELGVTAAVGYDNGTNPYNSAIPSEEIPGDIRFAALRIAALYSGLWRKAVSTDGAGAVQFWNPTTIPKDIMDILYLWRAKK